MNVTVDEVRMKEIKGLNLRAGRGKNLADRLCVMQAVDYVTSGGFSDHPECACPILTSYAIPLNDRADDKQRQQLKPLISKLIGTRDAHGKERSDLLVHRSITVILPLLTDALKLEDVSKKLRSFKVGEWRGAQTYIDFQRENIRNVTAYYADAAAAADTAAAYAATAAAYAAATAAAYAANAAAYADAAYAAANAAYATAAALAAANANATGNERWVKVRNDLWEAGFKALEQACQIGKEEKS